MFKRINIIGLFLVILGVLLANANAVTANTLFPDTKANRDEILYLAEKRIINGYTNGNFGPNDSIKRVHAVQMILRDLGVDTSDVKNPNFTDVSPGDYGYAEIAKATELKIISGMGDGTFAPNGILTRGQMAIILVNAYKLKGENPKSFKDVSDKHYAKSSISTLAAHNITNGYSDGTFRPNDTLTREHFSLFMARHLNDKFKPLNVETAYKYDVMDPFKQSVVLIELFDEEDEVLFQGSGFIVSNNLIATAFMNVSDGVKVVATTESGEKIELEGVVAYDEFNDMALVKPKEKIGLPALPLLEFSKTNMRDKVVALGSTENKTFTVRYGSITGRHELREEEGETNLFQTSTVMDFEMSGGPLVTHQGFVVGMNAFGFEEINFAVSTDHLAKLLKNYQTQKFETLQVEKFENVISTLYDFDEELDWDEDVEPEIEFDYEKYFIEENLTDITKMDTLLENKMTVEEIFIDVVHDQNKPFLFGITDTGKVMAINYETGAKEQLPLDLPAEKIYEYDGKLYITLLKGSHDTEWLKEDQQGAVAIVDSSKFEIIDLYDIAIDPFDIVADDTYFYVSSGSGEWVGIDSYKIATGEKVATSSEIFEKSELELHPGSNQLFSINSTEYPEDIEVHPIQNGVFSDYHYTENTINFPYRKNMKLSPDGKYMFDKTGNVFNVTNDQETNMEHHANLKNWYDNIGFSEERSEFYLIKMSFLYIYDYETLEPKKGYMFMGNGFYIFEHNGYVISVGEMTPPEGGRSVTTIQQVNLNDR